MFAELMDVSNMHGCFRFGRHHAVDLESKMVMAKQFVFSFFPQICKYHFFQMLSIWSKTSSCSTFKMKKKKKKNNRVQVGTLALLAPSFFHRYANIINFKCFLYCLKLVIQLQVLFNNTKMEKKKKKKNTRVQVGG